MTTTALQHIQSLPERWARNGLAASATLVLVPILMLEGAAVGMLLSGILCYVLPVAGIGYVWGMVIRHRFFAVRDMNQAEALMKKLPARCAIEGAIAFLTWILSLWALPTLANTLSLLGSQIVHIAVEIRFRLEIVHALMGVTLGVFAGWFIGATFRDALRHRLARVG